MPDKPDSDKLGEPLFVFKKGRAGKRRQRSGSKPEPDDDDDTRAIKQKKSELRGAVKFSTEKTAGTSKADLASVYAGTGGIQDQGDMGATKHLEEDTEHSRDKRAQKEAFMNGEGPSDGMYHGMSGYKDWRAGFRRENNVALHGPQRVSQFVRTTIRVDYQPDVCKDYKETGFCSYGDTCKFLHDRGDYKSGWELDRDWEEQQKAKRETAERRILEGKDPNQSSEEESDDDELPFACFICRRDWKDCMSDAVRTHCGHLFCEECALKRNAKSGRCAVCEKQTMGTFNVADDVMKKFDLTAGRAHGKKRSTDAGKSEDEGGWVVEEPGD